MTLHIGRLDQSPVISGHSPAPTLEEALSHRYTERERAHVQSQRARLVHGDPDEVRSKLLALQQHYSADELAVITITGDYESRRTSYRLLAEAFHL